MGRRQRFVRLVAACASAILAAALVGGPAAGQDDPVPASELSWSTSELPATPQSVDEGFLLRLDLGGIAALPTGEAVVVGTEIMAGAANDFAWLSPDGMAWELMSLPRPFWGIATSPVGVVAFGSGDLVSTSSDGRDWSPPAKVKDASLSGASSTSLGPVLLGSATKGKKQRAAGATLWRLDEAGEWEPTTVAKKGAAHDAVVSDAGVWLVRDDDGWLMSTDGEAWSRANIPSNVGSLIAVPGGFLATFEYREQDGSYVTTITTSADGLEWTEVTRVPRQLSTLVSGPLGVLALGPGSGPGTGAVLRSVDGGLTWEEALEPTFDGETSPTLATATADGFIALGQQPFPPGEPVLPMVWRAILAPPS